MLNWTLTKLGNVSCTWGLLIEWSNYIWRLRRLNFGSVVLLLFTRVWCREHPIFRVCNRAHLRGAVTPLLACSAFIRHIAHNLIALAWRIFCLIRATFLHVNDDAFRRSWYVMGINSHGATLAVAMDGSMSDGRALEFLTALDKLDWSSSLCLS